MKKSEIRQLIAEYKKLKLQIEKKNASQKRIIEKIKEIEHRYYNETGKELAHDLQEQLTNLK